MPFSENGGAQAEQTPPYPAAKRDGHRKIKKIEKNPLELHLLIDFLIAFLLKFKYNRLAVKTASTK